MQQPWLKLDAVTQMWLGIADRATRLELRQILRETVRDIVLDRSAGDIWVGLVGGTIMLHDGRTVGFNVGYATRGEGSVRAELALEVSLNHSVPRTSAGGAGAYGIDLEQTRRAARACRTFRSSRRSSPGWTASRYRH